MHVPHMYVFVYLYLYVGCKIQLYVLWQAADCVACTVQEVMTHLCNGDQPALLKPAVLAGACSLLNTMGVEDVMGDAPKAADWVSSTSHLHLPQYRLSKHICLNLTSVSQKNGRKGCSQTPIF